LNKPNTSILITGGTGFVGSHLVETLIAHGYQDVHVTSLSGTSGFLAGLLPQDHVHQLDLSDFAAVQNMLQQLQPTQIYHLAAHAAVSSSFEQGREVLENNLKLQLSLLEAVRDYLPKTRVLVVGSGMEYDLISYTQEKMISELHPLGPVSPYAVSKVIQDLLGLSYAYSYNLDIVRARPFNHIGERQTTDFAIPSFAQQVVAIERNQQDHISVGNLDAIRDFTDVKDVCEAYVLIMEKAPSKEVYNIGSGKGYTMREMLDMLSQLSTAQVRVEIDPNKVRPLDVPAIIADSSKIRQLGWEPHIPIQDALKRILEEWRQKT
jgi:GDP-4-dehydro-6-deoxy-D-mannose reductase